MGLWPSIARSQDGSIIGVVYRDVHNGYTKDADDAADLEYAYSTGGGGWGHEWIDLARGSGDFSSLAFRIASFCCSTSTKRITTARKMTKPKTSQIVRVNLVSISNNVCWYPAAEAMAKPTTKAMETR